MSHHVSDDSFSPFLLQNNSFVPVPDMSASSGVGVANNNHDVIDLTDSAPPPAPGPAKVSNNLQQISKGIYKVKNPKKPVPSTRFKAPRPYIELNDTQDTEKDNNNFTEYFGNAAAFGSPLSLSGVYSPSFTDSLALNSPSLSPKTFESPSPVPTIPVVSSGFGIWYYAIGTNRQEVKFDEETNALIENAFKSGKPHVSFEFDHFMRYTLFFDSMIMHGDLTNERISVRREAVSSDVIQIPVNQFNTDQTVQIKYPMEWSTQSQICELMEVAIGSPEFQHIQSKVGGLSSRIVSIKRIQNQHLWRRYYLERSFIEQKNGGAANEMELFHGTRTTCPVEIYNGEEGFDMRYSKKGLWGMGIYFASEADYSYKYGYCDPETDTIQVLFSKVAIGSAFSCLAGDNNLRTPPAKTKNHLSQSRIPFATDFYDSVVGVIGNSKIYTVYSNSKAYPSYLISFSKY
mmetsp:Transcript_10433/g.12873  ORF Transcript_10433/g.12873 Transcript_10433/m.12873 type:complete len:459 (-) Transcript_10433:59-1435(-)